MPAIIAKEDISNGCRECPGKKFNTGYAFRPSRQLTNTAENMKKKRLLINVKMVTPAKAGCFHCNCTPLILTLFHKVYNRNAGAIPIANTRLPFRNNSAISFITIFEEDLWFNKRFQATDNFGHNLQFHPPENKKVWNIRWLLIYPF